MTRSIAAFSGGVEFLRRLGLGQLTPTRFFVVTAAVAGLLFMLVTPPFQTPDEPSHFMRAYQISEGDFVVDPVDSTFGGYVPRALADTISLTATNPTLKFTPNKKYDINKTWQAFTYKINPNDRVPYEFSGTAVYPPISYAPQAIGMLIGRIFSAPPVLLMYFGRVMNLVAWILLFALIIRLIPRQKWAVAFVALLPSAIFQSVSLSADVMALGFVGLFLAYILRLREQKVRLTNKQLGILFAIAIAMTLSKQVMFLFLPLVFLLPNNLFSTKKVAYIAKAALIIVPVLLFAAWMAIIAGVRLADTTNGQDAVAQFRYIVHHPFDYLNVLWNTYFYWWGDGVTASFIGVFGWMDTPLAEWIIMVGYAGLAFMLLASVQGQKVVNWMNRWHKLLLGLIMLAYAGAVSTALYLYYSPVQYKIIVGLQGRYFLPLLPLAIPLLYGKWFTATETVYRRVAMGVPLFLIVASIITLYVRYYVENV